MTAVEKSLQDAFTALRKKIDETVFEELTELLGRTPSITDIQRRLKIVRLKGYKYDSYTWDGKSFLRIHDAESSCVDGMFRLSANFERVR